ncbi:MAG: hypothetical protein AB7G06_03695 [Bdellovibrionales bacterium]
MKYTVSAALAAGLAAIATPADAQTRDRVAAALNATTLCAGPINARMTAPVPTARAAQGVVQGAVPAPAGPPAHTLRPLAQRAAFCLSPAFDSHEGPMGSNPWQQFLNMPLSREGVAVAAHIDDRRVNGYTVYVNAADAVCVGSYAVNGHQPVAAFYAVWRAGATSPQRYSTLAELQAALPRCAATLRGAEQVIGTRDYYNSVSFSALMATRKDQRSYDI